jgi:hypothetical protein
MRIWMKAYQATHHCSGKALCPDLASMFSQLQWPRCNPQLAFEIGACMFSSCAPHLLRLGFSFATWGINVRNVRV